MAMQTGAVRGRTPLQRCALGAHSGDLLHCAPPRASPGAASRLSCAPPPPSDMCRHSSSSGACIKRICESHTAGGPAVVNQRSQSSKHTATGLLLYTTHFMQRLWHPPLGPPPNALKPGPPYLACAFLLVVCQLMRGCLHQLRGQGLLMLGLHLQRSSSCCRAWGLRTTTQATAHARVR
jgi:hypothetical protein